MEDARLAALQRTEHTPFNHKPAAHTLSRTTASTERGNNSQALASSLRLPARAIISAKHGVGFFDVDTGNSLETTIISHSPTNSYQMATAFGHHQAGLHSTLGEAHISSASKSPYPVITKQVRF